MNFTNRKLTEQEIAELRFLHRGGVTVAALSDWFSVGMRYALAIVNYEKRVNC